MSDHFLVVIPADPKATLPSTAEDIRKALAEITGSTESRVKDYGRIQFIDCGENFERISCPACGAEASVDWWGHQMDHCWDDENGFDLHAHAMPCCGTPMSLDKLNYEWPQGFARWMVSARNTGRGPLTSDELMRLDDVAGIKLMAIAQMY